MADTLFGISAFRYHRVPPQVLALLPPVPQYEMDKRRFSFRNHLLIKDAVKLPLHLMVTQRSKRATHDYFKCHLSSEPVPFGSIWETELGLFVPSPSLTLYQLASTLSKTQLAMAMYEMCGSFSVFEPSPDIESLLAAARCSGCLPQTSWSRIEGGDGRPSSLWRRPPLIEVGELRQFAVDMSGRRHCKKFQQAAELVSGVVASPFEAQLSLLLTSSRRDGGEGLGCFENNKRIALSSKAARIAGQCNCYADLFFNDVCDSRGLVVECQSKMIHDNSRSLLSDSDRITALQQMGFEVLPLTFDQILYSRNFDIVVRMIFKKLGRRYCEKASKQLKAQADLRRELFIDWSTLGS